jgi:hypothetical protein
MLLVIIHAPRGVRIEVRVSDAGPQKTIETTGEAVTEAPASERPALAKAPAKVLSLGGRRVA